VIGVNVNNTFLEKYLGVCGFGVIRCLWL